MLTSRRCVLNILFLSAVHNLCGCNGFVLPASLHFPGGQRISLPPKYLQQLTKGSTFTHSLRLGQLKSKWTNTTESNVAKQKNTPWRNFWIGVSDVYDNYWMHYSRQLALGYTAICLINSRVGQFIETPLIQLFVFARDNEISYRWGTLVCDLCFWITSCICQVANNIVDRKYFYSTSYVFGIVAAPIVEEILYRLFLLQSLKFVFQKLPRFQKRKSIGQSQHHLLSPWSVLTSLWFAVNHINFDRELPMATKLVVEAFAGSLFMLTPMFENFGIFAAIGVHAAWNLAVNVPFIRTVALAAHFTKRLLEPNPPLSLNNYDNSRFQIICELWLELLYIDKILTGRSSMASL